MKPKKASKKPSLNTFLLMSLINYLNINFKNKLECLKVFYTKLKYEDIKEVIERLELVF